jgi:hypothetical protein
MHQDAPLGAPPNKWLSPAVIARSGVQPEASDANHGTGTLVEVLRA